MNIRPDSKPEQLPRVGGGLPIAACVAVAAGLAFPFAAGYFSAAEAAVVAVFDLACLATAGACAVAIIRRLERSRRSLWELSRRDGLTGVGNYRAMHERLSEEIARHARRDRQLALILIDLDGFKQVNERFGHLEGDRLLAEIGWALRDAVRAEDSVFRQGGDEFAVIAPETNDEEAEDVAARLRNRVRECSDERRPISACTGFAVFPGDGRSSDELIARADDDLLESKREGRAT